MTEVWLCPDKFNRSPTAFEVCSAFCAGTADVRPVVHVESFQVSLGCDGLHEDVTAAGFVISTLTAQGPTGQSDTVRIATRGRASGLELVEIVELRRLPADRPAPLTASTLGLGQAMLATLRSGIDLLLQVGDFSQQISSVDLVIFGDGSLDHQSLRGKAPIRVANAARAVSASHRRMRCQPARRDPVAGGRARCRLLAQSLEPEGARSIERCGAACAA